MKVKITWVDPEKKINGIKDIRACTGLSLRDAKEVYESVAAGRPVEAEVTNVGAYFDAEYMGAQEILPGGTPSDEIIDAFLAALPGELRVNDLRAVRAAGHRAAQA